MILIQILTMGTAFPRVPRRSDSMLEGVFASEKAGHENSRFFIVTTRTQQRISQRWTASRQWRTTPRKACSPALLYVSQRRRSVVYFPPLQLRSTRCRQIRQQLDSERGNGTQYLYVCITANKHWIYNPYSTFIHHEGRTVKNAKNDRRTDRQ